MVSEALSGYECLLAASGSAAGASREIFRRASANNWILISTPYGLEEVIRNLPELAPSASADWERLRGAFIDHGRHCQPRSSFSFPVAKDRPILFSALAWADVLLTLDHGDFGGFMEKPFYGLIVMRPGTFLHRERAAGRLL
jgi:hypothetical protein